MAVLSVGRMGSISGEFCGTRMGAPVIVASLGRSGSASVTAAAPPPASSASTVVTSLGRPNSGTAATGDICALAASAKARGSVAYGSLQAQCNAKLAAEAAAKKAALEARYAGATIRPTISPVTSTSQKLLAEAMSTGANAGMVRAKPSTAADVANMTIQPGVASSIWNTPPADPAPLAPLPSSGGGGGSGELQASLPSFGPGSSSGPDSGLVQTSSVTPAPAAVSPTKTIALAGGGALTLGALAFWLLRRAL